MSYRIEYGPPIPPQYVQKTNSARIQAMTAAFLLLFSLLVRQFFPAGTEKLRQLLLPQTHTVTQDALEIMMTYLRDGETLTDAFSAFCVYIIDNDEILSN